MKLIKAINQYISWRQSHGAVFAGETKILYRFSNMVGAELECGARISPQQVEVFLNGCTKPTRSYRNRYAALTGFYRFAISRGYLSEFPLPPLDQLPVTPPPPLPYIFSHDELQRVFAAIDNRRGKHLRLDSETLHTLLLTTYGTGMRIAEVLNLTLNDVDLTEAVLTVRHTKFFKTRLVPLGNTLAEVLRAYVDRRCLERALPKGMDSTLFVYRDGSPVMYWYVRKAFTALVAQASVQPGPGQRSPSLHALRHSFAVNRITSWYRQGADVQQLLPTLSTYLGHASLHSTQVYISMTPELLHQASIRFHRHVNGDCHG